MKANTSNYRIGIDVGSTTLKIVVLDPTLLLVYKTYKRHNAAISTLLADELRTIAYKFPEASFQLNITGSAGMGISERTGIPFIQEVVASIEVINKVYPDVHTLIDLGGEDSKIVFFEEGKQPTIRMNGSCAGGTGAFIDQMADLMHIPIEELSKQALAYEKTYPIASRCGVFAKTDIQNLICRNVPQADVAKSILNAVALQTITSLGRGTDIRPKVLCIGGPLTFIPALRDSFREVLGMEKGDLIVPEHSEYFPAWGCALHTNESVLYDLPALIDTLGEQTIRVQEDALPCLFEDEEVYKAWNKNRSVKQLRLREPSNQDEVSCFLGIDSGSTTTKILILDEEERLVYSFYSPNEGNPLKKTLEGLQQFYHQAKEQGLHFRFVGSCATGYGEDLIRSALNLDHGIVETMAHLSGAQFVDPEVSFILDIGGQDMKSIFVENGVIANIELNEACSSGCGSFLQNFAATMNMELKEFSRAACLAKHPADLGSRCTVFMNSKVKQSLRQNATPGDIAAGLAYSVVKNCLFKVLKINNLNKLGEHIVVQGGTFRNDAVYRALEVLSGKTVSTTDHPELMGALGAALYAKKQYNSQNTITAFSGQEALPDIRSIDTKELQCKGCSNQCSVLRFRFANGNTSYAGNKCEKVFFNKQASGEKGIDFFPEKNRILFEEREQGEGSITIGIPRVLNLFENYPFWESLLTGCGFRVVLSPESTFPLYQKGVSSVMSDNICFPAKVVHGHIRALIEQRVDRIFYPIVPKEQQDFGEACNSFNCPVVCGYPDVIRSSMDPAEKHSIPFDKPVINFHTPKACRQTCFRYLETLGVNRRTMERAYKKAIARQEEVRHKLVATQKELLSQYLAEGKPVFIVAGRPYHADPLIHQKVGQILSDLGVNALTDDVFTQMNAPGFSGLNIVSQWTYPNRVVQAAMEVAKLPANVQLIQLNSFGCGPDSFFMDEVTAILRQAGKNHTILRIDEIASPGAIRLRLRSLIESLKANQSITPINKVYPFPTYPGKYQISDRGKTILVPWFADFLSPFVPALGELAGYKLVNLPPSTKHSADLGLKYGHNEVCYPSTLVLGDIIAGLQSGKYDLENTVVAMTQTGGQCRATNYLAQIKSGLENAGFAHIPVLALTAGKVYQNDQSAFRIPLRGIVHIGIYTLLYGDALQQMYSASIVREKTKGDTQRLFDFYIEQGIEAVRRKDVNRLVELLRQAVQDFNQIPIHDRQFKQVGLVGEIYVKYNNYGQAFITQWLREQHMEVVTPPILDFVTQYFVNVTVKEESGIEKRSFFQKLLTPIVWKYLHQQTERMERILKGYRFYQPSESIFRKAEDAAEVLDLSNLFGEGWLIAAEVASFSRRGIHQVVCIQPFGCIANHVVAKGIENRLKKRYSKTEMLYLDIDSGMAEVNLQNRLHFLIKE